MEDSDIDGCGMNKTEILDANLHRLMWSGRQYTLGELHRLSASEYMTRHSFRNRMNERKRLYVRENGYYRCVAVVLPAPCELKRKLKEALARLWKR